MHCHSLSCQSNCATIHEQPAPTRITPLQEDLTVEQRVFYQYEESSPDCLIGLRFLDSGRRIEGARYIADMQFSEEMAAIVARAIKEQQRRGEAAVGFSAAAGDCLAFKYYRDAQECRNMKEREQYIGTILPPCPHTS